MPHSDSVTNSSIPQAQAAPKAFELAGKRFGEGPLFFLAGPCVLQTRELTLEIAGTVAELMASRGLPYVFKASFDKANRSSLTGGRGPGIEEGLQWLADVKREIGVPVVTPVA